MRRHDLVREPDAGNLHVRFDERRLETEPWRGVRHRHRRKPPGTATPSAYRHRASRRLYSNLGATLIRHAAQTKQSGSCCQDHRRSARPGPGARPASPGATGFHPLRSGEPVGEGPRSGHRSWLHGPHDGAVLPAAKQPRQPAPIQARQRAIHALHDGERRQQAPVRQPAAPVAGLGVDRSGTDGKPRAGPGRVAFPSSCEPWIFTATAAECIPGSATK